MSEMDTNSDGQKPDRPRKRRRWFRYGLRTLVALMVLAAIASAWLASMVRARRDEQLALQLLRSAHEARTINVLYANPFAERDGPGEMEMFFQGGPEWMQRWLGVDLLRTPVSLHAYAPGNSFSYGVDERGRLLIARSYKTGLTDFDMLRVKQFTHLEFLALDASPVGDDGAAQLADLRQLKTLILAHTQITDEGLRALAALPNLQTLDVSRTHVSDDAIDVLASYPALAEVNLEMTRVSDAGVQRLKALKPELVIER